MSFERWAIMANIKERARQLNDVIFQTHEGIKQSFSGYVENILCLWAIVGVLQPLVAKVYLIVVDLTNRKR